MRPMLALALVTLGLTLVGCAPQIGDSCDDSVDCSINGDRVCDVAQPRGYCSIQSCDADTCPENGVCARFRPSPARFAQSWCMKPCQRTSDCRVEDGYACFSADELNACVPFTPDPTSGDLPILELLDEEREEAVIRFCAAVPPDCAIPP